MALVISLTAFAATSAGSATGGQRDLSDSCTIAEPAARATVEARLPGADAFCELTSQGLAGEVFHAPTLVTPELWHYQGAELSCRLQYRRTLDWITIHGSAPACKWFTRRASGWQARKRPRTRGMIQPGESSRTGP